MTVSSSAMTSAARSAGDWPGLRTPGEPTARVLSSSGRYVAWNSSIPPTLTAPRVSPWYASVRCTNSGRAVPPPAWTECW